ncbi:MAG TPA: hypothetical protein VK912_17520 [Longimicrobiales bacterium]|nr:hypothetical protein [Longimicrobiales bacterium]
MSRRGEVPGGGTRMRWVLASVGLLGALFLLAPREAYGAKSWKQCVDESFAEYNECLMETTSWFNRKLCDLDWELKVALCSAYIAGDIKNAYNEGSPD